MAASPERRSVSFGELLALLMGWAGRRVMVAIATAADPPVMVATIAGRLTGGEELSDGGVGAVAFTFADAKAALVLAPECFEGAGWHERDRATLVVAWAR
jgi:hypothetical protein